MRKIHTTRETDTNSSSEMDDPAADATLVIPRHRAMFRMDGNGRWHNKDGPFMHQRVIDHFNAAIEKDGMGYFITQQRGGITEKVYFPHEGTALFVVEVLWGDPVKARLNTGCMAIMDPGNLYLCEDHLYYRLGDQSAKFNQRALEEISEKLSCDQGRYCYDNGSTRTPLPKCKPDW